MLTEISTTPPTGWDEYVGRHPLATAYHRAGAVEIGRRAFGLRVTFVSCVRSGSEIVGVLPLVEQSSLLFGRFLISVPYFTYGGILASDPAAAAALAEAAVALGRERGAAHVELRHSRPIEGLSLPERLDKVSMVLELPESDDQLSKRLSSKLRSQIKRGDREQPEIAWGRAELIDEFYAIFSSAMHRLGTPVYPRAFFHTVLEALPGLTSVVVLRAHGRVQAAGFTVRHGDRVEVPWAAASDAAKAMALNMRLYREMLADAVRSGARAFDFGRSTADSGTYRFKAQWGAKPQQLHWHYSLANAGPLPQLNHSNPKYSLAVALWKRMPLWCANLIGPRIAGKLP